MNRNLLKGQAIDITPNMSASTLTVDAKEASSTQKGVVQLATVAEIVAGVVEDKAISVGDTLTALGQMGII